MIQLAQKFYQLSTWRIALAFFSFSIPFFAVAQSVTTQIKINQLGFYTQGPKLAIVTGDSTATNFYITSTNLRDTMFTGLLGVEKQSAYSSTKTKAAVFTSFTTPGSYVVVVPGLGHSYVFSISNTAGKEAAVATLKGFYYQRASMPLQEKFAGKWHRSTGHPDKVVYIHGSAATAQRPEGTAIASPGGWYDAGDYNKYIVNSGITMGTLLSAYEDDPAYYEQLQTNIPESNDAIPDILNEALYNLRWMLTMQDPNDGGVYNKCTNANFDGMIMPGITTAPRYVVQKGTTATLDLAAVAAQASRIFKAYQKQYPGLSDSCLKAAKKAWGWALQNPSLEYNQDNMNKTFKPAIVTGGYGDRNFSDEWLWAAAELFITTKDNNFYEAFIKQYKNNVGLPGWGNVAMLGYYSFIRLHKTMPPAITDTINKMKAALVRMADEYSSKLDKNAFGTIMGQSARDFGWGGNATAANQGILLLNVYRFTGDKKYIDNALTNLDYLLGRNATGYCFVTGLGSHSPMFPHHRPSAGDGITDPVPGLLVGGPNISKQDGCTYTFNEVETSYVDSTCSYASNEIAINWNAPIVYLANAIEALKEKAGYTSKK